MTRKDTRHVGRAVTLDVETAQSLADSGLLAVPILVELAEWRTRCGYRGENTPTWMRRMAERMRRDPSYVPSSRDINPIY
jgi:hypothetical protein